MYTERKNSIRTVGFIAMAAVILMIAIYIYNGKFRDEMAAQMRDTLQSAAEQNVLTIESEIQDTQDFLDGLAQELKSYNKEQKEELLRFLGDISGVYDYKRIGFIYPDGEAYTTDGYEKNLSFRDFFQKSMNGEKYVTDVLTDSIGKQEPINVISVPVYGEDGVSVEGVLFATYRTEKFKELMKISSFEGQGYSLVVNSDGTLIVDSEKSPMYGKENIFTALAENEDANQTAAEEITPLLSGKKSGGGSYYLDGKRYYYCMPLSFCIDDGYWYVFTVVPAEVLEGKVAPVLKDVSQLLTLIIMAFGVIVFLYLHFYQKNRKVLYNLAYQDPLTGGNNYAFFIKMIRCKKDVPGYLISMDLSEFKIINNTCGMETGNVVLKSVWDILYSGLQGEELAAHMNADRFILCFEEEKREQVEARLKKLLDQISSLSETMNVPRILPYFGVYHTRDLSDVETGYSYSSHARHQVKGRRDQNYAFYEEKDYQLMLENRKLEDQFETAIRKHQFEVWYQPKYSTTDASIVGSEALVRWRLEDGSLVSPGRFIPLFEKNGMISVLDEYMFREVCMQQNQWMKEGREILPVSVNISRASLYYSKIVEKYRDILNECQIDARYIQLEITESATIDNMEIRRLIDQFHKAGFELLLDDFGNGYSSLASLNEMKFDVLKLDKSLIDCIGDSNGEKLLYHIVRLVKSLGLKITAEGVESREQVGFLQKLKCNDIQGFYYSRPLPGREYAEML